MAAVVALAACGGSTSGSTAGTVEAELPNGSTTSTVEAELPAGGSTAGTVGVEVATGEPLYQASCGECHGTDLRGTDQGPSLLSIVYEPAHHSDAAFQLAVRNGSPAHHWSFGPMEPVPGLTDEDVDAITVFVRSVQEREGFEPYPP